MTTMTETMFKMQDELNQRVHPQWRSQNWPWHTAISEECQELINELGWKWWKKDHKIDWGKACLEVVDIWHFVISDITVGLEEECQNFNDCVISSFSGVNELSHVNMLINAVEDFQVDVLTGCYNIEQLVIITKACGMGLSDLFVQYIGKNALNAFRQDNGYKSGTYARTWPDGRDDNDHLAEVLQHCEPGEPDEYYGIVYAELEKRYS